MTGHTSFAEPANPVTTAPPGARRPEPADQQLASLLNASQSIRGAFAREVLAELDRQESFPGDACQVLDNFGLPAYYVPLQHGGKLNDMTELMQLWRAVSRHDLTVAIGHGKTFLGSVCYWLAGTADQQSQAAREVIKGSIYAWGLTERAHGSDLLAGELTAVPHEDGWILEGEKWLINNASRGQVMCLLARTSATSGSRGYSLFILDKRLQPQGAFSLLPKVKTHGIRGADISGIALHCAVVPRHAMIGAPGAGLEIVLKALQLTRTACVGLSLGASDQAFAIAVDFMRSRALYDNLLIELPLARATLGEALAMHLCAELVGLTATRSVHALPEEMSVTSVIAKAFVPGAVESVIKRLGEMLGARAFLDQVHRDGMYQKLERDHRIVPIFDGSTVVNRSSLITQFPLLASAWKRARNNTAGLETTLTPGLELPAFNPTQLQLIALQGCSVLQGLPKAAIQISALATAKKLPQTVATQCRRLLAHVEALYLELEQYAPTTEGVPDCAFELASRYERCFAGAVCLQFWLFNHTRDDGPALRRKPQWLQACLAWVLETLGDSKEGERGAFEALATLLLGHTTTWPINGISLLRDTPEEARS
ncbi:acyl-CoA dehydrogenase family protein [Pseudomonas gingeri]|uniref:acyl-CoA dehydrogenase family protein n=1 Tax=Pseudomonas gingeri TaxID=117681 RepID=UPI00159FA68B|nr:acyl-CoA dehydrogenase family protein [Pseudomonas gingeri]NWA29718.1 acyl-CoA dehydrogenase family protein [Pseudomonas gingeri]